MMMVTDGGGCEMIVTDGGGCEMIVNTQGFVFILFSFLLRNWGFCIEPSLQLCYKSSSSTLHIRDIF